jgi:diacylglycerol kinase (ATP)
MTRKITLVVRPPTEESRTEELRAAVAELRAEGHRITVRMTFESGDARRFARGAALSGCDVVAAAGGDGTVNEVVNGLAFTERKVALAVIPMGTANDFARGLRLPLDTLSALRIAAEGEPADVDVARVNRRCFINVSTGGFGAEATQVASRAEKKWLGGVSYLIRGAQKLVRFVPGNAAFSVDDDLVHDGEFVFFAVGNASLTGGGTRIAPRASIGDGKLDVVVARGMSRLDFLALLPDLRAGTHLESPHVSYFQASKFEVNTRTPVSVNADGEAVAGESFVYDLLEWPLSVITG